MIGFKEIMIAILAVLILVLITLTLFRVIDSGSSSAGSFGEQAAGVFG